MKIVETTFERLPRERLEIGFEGENQRATVRINCASVFAEYPNATPTLIVKPLFADAYPVVVDRNGTDVDWLITSEILSFNGDGEIQLVFYKDQVICKSAVSKIRVSRSLQVTGEMPDPVVQWIENANRKLAEVDAQIVELEGMVDTATDAATRAEQSASTASTKAEQAAGSAATATEKATEATNAAGTATAKAAEAALSATQAGSSAVSAADSERGAIQKAAEAAQSAQTATTKAGQATEAAQTATGKAGEASASATAAQTSATNAASSATAASASETAAKASETAAGASATQAAQSVLDAGTNAQTAMQKAAEAQQSATNAAASATNAATSAETASTKAGEAAQSAQAVEETAEQLAESLEQISQNTADIAEHEQYAEATYAKKTDLSNLTSDLDLVQTSGTIVETEDAFPTFAEDVTAEIVPVQSGSGNPSPENVRPITGFDGVKVTRTGKNLFDASSLFRVNANVFRSGFFFLQSGEYTFSRPSVDNNIYNWYVRSVEAESYSPFTKLVVGGTNVSSGAFSLENGSLVYLEFYYGAGISDSAIRDIQIELGSTATPYEPYQGIQVELPFGRTVYGGQIDLTTGKLTVTHFGRIYTSTDIVRNNGITDLSDSTISPLTRVSYDCSRNVDMPNAAEVAIEIQNTGKFSHGLYRGDNSGWTSKSYHAYAAGGATHIFLACEATAAKVAEYLDAQAQAGTPVTIYYPLATPQVYNLTPAQVLLLRDYNVLWSDTGDIINFEYRAGAFVTKKAYDALKEATLIHNTASGAIASFVDGAEMPVDEVTARINPVQDLHGYDHPWPAGVNLNLLDFSKVSVSGTHYGMTFSKGTAEGTIVISGTLTTSSGAVAPITYANNSLSGKGYVFLTEHISGDSVIALNRTYGFRTESERAIAVYLEGNVGQSYTETIRISVYATTQTAWTPYANICPISGFDSVKVTRMGKNMINPSELVYFAGGHNVWYGTQLPPDIDFVFSTDSAITGLYVEYSDDDEMPSISAGTRWVSITYKYNTTSLRFNSGSHKWYRLMTYEINGVVRDRLYQLELGSTATDYEPYQGETYEVEFPSEAGTVYGGELTVNKDGSCGLAVNRKYALLSDPDKWLVQTGTVNFRYNYNFSDRKITDSSYTGLTCSYLPVVYRVDNYARWTGDNAGFFGLMITGKTLDEIKADATAGKIAICYDLANPITYTLTPTEIRTLLGENNIWSDAGNVSVKYNADTKLYIDNKITQAIAAALNS